MKRGLLYGGLVPLCLLAQACGGEEAMHPPPATATNATANAAGNGGDPNVKTTKDVVVSPELKAIVDAPDRTPADAT